MYNVTLGASLQPFVAVGKQYVLHILNVCVALGTQNAMRMRHIIMCGLPSSVIYFHIISLNVRF